MVAGDGAAVESARTIRDPPGIEARLLGPLTIRRHGVALALPASRKVRALFAYLALAPRPVPTIIDIGVANPSAHGQAMIKTATALTSAWARRGAGPTSPQTTNVTIATRTTAGTK